MEKKFTVTISIQIFPEEGASAYPFFDRLTGDQPIAAFLYDIAGNGRRFKVESAGFYDARVSGACTEEELLLLSEQMKDFFEIHGLAYGLNRWEIKRGTAIPPVRELFEDGTVDSPQVALVVTFLNEWAKAQSKPPAQTFFTLIQERLGWRVPFTAQTAMHLNLLIHTELPVWRIWDAGQAVIKEWRLAPYLVEFSVREEKKLEEETEELW